SGAKGSGYVASVREVVGAASRATTSSSDSSGDPAGIPVCAGLSTATLRPRVAAAAVIAATTIVLPTPVSVPVTTTGPRTGVSTWRGRGGSVPGEVMAPYPRC